jgi:hypothetical protein
MKIINWNLGRPSQSKSQLISDKLNELNGDVLILTETDSKVRPSGDYTLVASEHLPQDFDGDLRVTYKSDENRTSIWTKYPVIKTHQTYDAFTSVCTEIRTPFGDLTIYATIIGVFNGLRPRFRHDLERQLLDFEAIFLGKQVAIVGDYNISFKGRAYPSNAARQTLNETFKKYAITNVTAEIADAVDHVAISSKFIENRSVAIETWNLDKKLSDHIGISVTLA